MKTIANVNFASLEEKYLALFGKELTTMQMMHHLAETGDTEAKRIAMLWPYGGSTGEEAERHLDKTRKVRIENAMIVYGD